MPRQVIRRLCGLFLMTIPVAVLGAPTAATAVPGDLDPGFGVRGIGPAGSAASTSTFGGAGRDTAVTPEDTILTLSDCGCGRAPTVSATFADGTRDESFGVQGVAALPGEQPWAALALQPGGGIVVVGQELGLDSESHYGIRAIRLTPTGQIDQTFGGDGRAELDFGSGYEAAYDVIVDPSGEIIIAARLKDTEAVIGLLPNGALDNAFGDQGVLRLAAANPSYASPDAIEPYPGGDYLVAGAGHLVRVTPQGTINTAYGDAGRSRISVPGGGDIGDFAVRADGTAAVVTTWSFYDLHNVSNHPDLVVVDPTGNGVYNYGAALNLGRGHESEGLAGAAWDADNRLVLTGFLGDGAFIARLASDGRLDPSFSEGGLGRYPYLYSSFPGGQLKHPQILSDGRIVASAGASLVGFLGSGASADADADGVSDGSDLCPRRAAQTFDGCVHLSSLIRMRRTRRGFAGSVSGPSICIRPDSEHIEVALMRIRPGRDQKLRQRPTRSKGRFTFRIDPRGSRFYAKVKGQATPGVVVCNGAKSPKLPSRGRPRPAGTA